MNNFKYSIDNIVRHPIRLFLIIIQITIGIMVLLNALSLTLETIDTVNRSKGLFDGKKVYSVIDKTSGIKNTAISEYDDLVDRQYSLYEYLTQNNNFKICAQQETNIIIKDFTKEDKFYDNLKEKYYVDPYDNVEGTFSNIKGYYIDYGYMKEFPLEVAKGRTFKKDDFNLKQEIPIILGSDYEGIYNIGDEFSYFDYMNLTEKKMKVIGLLKDNTYIFCGGTISNIDDRVVCPMVNLNRDSSNFDEKFLLWRAQSLVVTEDEEDTLKQIRTKCSELGLYDYDFKSYEKEIKVIIDYLKESAISSMLVSLVMLIFISIGIITVQIKEIKEKMMEFGIHLLNGASKKDIIIRTYITISLYLGIGMILGSYFYSLGNGVEYNIRLLIISIVLFVLLEIIISFFPTRKIKKMQITSFIRGLSE